MATFPARVLLASAVSALLGALACGKPTPGEAPPAAEPAAVPGARPTKRDCSYCAVSTYGGETRCMDVQDGPCGSERVGSCMHVNAYCADACCADAGR